VPFVRSLGYFRGELPHARSLGGTPVLLMLEVDDVDALGERMVDAGGTIVYPIADREGESRGGRLRDPFGHEWMISQRAKPNPS